MLTQRHLASVLLLLLLLLCVALPSSARSESIQPLGTIPDDLREVSGPKDPSGISNLRSFPHRPWLSGSSIALLPGERQAVIADTDNDSVVVVNVATGVAEKRIAVGRRPERLVVAPDGRVYVTNRGSRSVSLVDPVRGVEVRTAEAGVEPLSLALTVDSATLLVTSSATGELLAFDAKSLGATRRLSLTTPWPAAVTAHPDGRRAFVTHMHGDKVDVVDIPSLRVTGALTLPSQDTGLPGRLQGRAKSPRIPNLALAAVVSPGGTRLFVAHTMVDTGSNRGVTIASGGYGMGGEAPIVTTVATFDLETGKLLRPDVEFTRAGFNGNAFQQDAAVQMLAQPIALATDPVRARLLLVAMGSDRVMSLDTRASDPITRPLASHIVGQAPKGVAITADGATAIVHDAQSYAVSIVLLRAAPVAGTESRTTGRDLEFQLTSRHLEFGKSPLPADAARGRRLFTFALDARVGGAARFACASCHPDGRQDGMVWRIGAGPRQTPILADRLDGTGPFNWLGTEAHLQDNILQTVKRLGGTGITKTDADDLAAYMTRYMPGFDNPSRGTLVAEGKALFESAEVGCAGCHNPRKRFTDGDLHEVGTTTPIELELWKRFGIKAGGPPPGTSPPRIDQVAPMPEQQRPTEPVPKAPVAYNTPSLRHLWASAPYLHDGSVRSLRELLTTGNPGDRMGHTSQLSPRQVDALVAYLKTL